MSAEPPPRADGAAAAWQPIVVDRATVEFEPRPPGVPVRRHIPDTVFDGWSSDFFTVRSASVRGYAHRYNGAPRQDHVTVFFQQRGAREEVLFAVADGVSNARHGELGAAAAAEAAIEALQQFLLSGRRLDWSAIAEAAVRHMTSVTRRHLKITEPTAADVSALLATTLTIGAVGALPDRARVLMTRIGDSGAWVLADGAFQSVFDAKQHPDAAVVSSGVSALPYVPDPMPIVSFDLRPHEVLLVGTDGFGDPLGDGTGQVGQLFARHLADPPPPRGLAHLLDFSRETFDDDRTLLAVWPRHAQREAA